MTCIYLKHFTYLMLKSETFTKVTKIVVLLTPLYLTLRKRELSQHELNIYEGNFHRHQSQVINKTIKGKNSPTSPRVGAILRKTHLLE